MALIGVMSSFESSTAELGNERTPRFERLLTSISHHFLRLDATNLEVGIIGALRSICEATGADRAALFEISSDGRKIASAHTTTGDWVWWCGRPKAAGSPTKTDEPIWIAWLPIQPQTPGITTQKSSRP